MNCSYLSTCDALDSRNTETEHLSYMIGTRGLVDTFNSTGIRQDLVIHVVSAFEKVLLVYIE